MKVAEREHLISLAENNIGALSVLTQMHKLGRGNVITMLEHADIKGASVWVLFKDISNLNHDMLQWMVKNVPEPLLKRAADDREGNAKVLMSEWIKQYKSEQQSRI